MSDVGIGYTLATGRLFCDFAEFHVYAEKLLARPILTHEFADSALWTELRDRFEALVIELSVNTFKRGIQTMREVQQ